MKPTRVNYRDVRDRCVGAAQKLEYAARQLRERANVAGRSGAGLQTPDDILMWALSDVQMGISNALRELETKQEG